MRCVPEARMNGTGEPRHVSYADLRRAVSGFNLVASDELVAQLMQTLDTDHDGLLCLSEFVTGLAADNSVQLVEPQLGVSSRRHFRSIKFHHPLHNMAHLSPHHQFEDER